jgi:hypothetical protein
MYDKFKMEIYAAGQTIVADLQVYSSFVTVDASLVQNIHILKTSILCHLKYLDKKLIKE